MAKVNKLKPIELTQIELHHVKIQSVEKDVMIRQLSRKIMELQAEIQAVRLNKLREELHTISKKKAIVSQEADVFKKLMEKKYKLTSGWAYDDETGELFTDDDK